MKNLDILRMDKKGDLVISCEKFFQKKKDFSLCLKCQARRKKLNARNVNQNQKLEHRVIQ